MDPNHTIPSFPAKSATFLLPSPAGHLEVMAARPDADLQGIGIMCHPDPRQGGAMQNKVVTTVVRAWLDLGWAAVRFNFRGVGSSTGEYGHTEGELADLNTVIDWAKQALPDLPLRLGGFSFGSYISARAAQTAHPQYLLSIAPPVNHYDFNSLTGIACPWLVIQGDQDEIVPCAQVQSWASHPPAPLQLIVMKGVGHFFHGRLLELRDYIVKAPEFLSF